MAGKGPPPKAASRRQRRNKPATRSTLPPPSEAASNKVPELPLRGDPPDPWPLKVDPEAYLDRWPDGPNAELAHQILNAGDDDPWHPLVVKWWDSVWQSPMASEFMEVDRIGGLLVLAGHYHDFFSADSKTAREAASDKIRLWSKEYGLDPMARRSLQWEVARAEEAERKRRPASRTEEKSEDDEDGDPRMKLVS